MKICLKNLVKKKVTARHQETEAPRQPARRQNPFELVLPLELADLASTHNIQVAQVRQPPITQPLPPRQPPTTQPLPPCQPSTTQSGTRTRELLLS